MMKRFLVSYEHVITDSAWVVAETEEEAQDRFYADTQLEGVQIYDIEEIEPT